MNSKTTAVLLVLLCVGLWALIPVVAKLGQADMDHHQFLFWSSLISFAVLYGVTVARKKQKNFLEFTMPEWLFAVGLGFLGTYSYYILLYFAYAHAQGLEVLVLQYTWPIFTALFSVMLLKERLSVRTVIALSAGFFGAFIVITKGNLQQLHLEDIGVDSLVIIAAVAFALFSVLSKKVKIEPLNAITVYFLTATIASFLSMFLFSRFSFPPVNSVLPVLLNGLFVNGFSYLFWIKALKKAEASFVAPFVFLTPVLSTIYLIVFFNEPFLPVYMISLACVVAGGLINSR